eukprot:SAG22_NODE_1085_length_5632_cov_40.777697_2_plen_401_part_00
MLAAVEYRGVKVAGHIDWKGALQDKRFPFHSGCNVGTTAVPVVGAAWTEARIRSAYDQLAQDEAAMKQLARRYAVLEQDGTSAKVYWASELQRHAAVAAVAKSNALSNARLDSDEEAAGWECVGSLRTSPICPADMVGSAVTLDLQDSDMADPMQPQTGVVRGFVEPGQSVDIPGGGGGGGCGGSGSGKGLLMCTFPGDDATDGWLDLGRSSFHVVEGFGFARHGALWWPCELLRHSETNIRQPAAASKRSDGFEFVKLVSVRRAKPDWRSATAAYLRPCTPTNIALVLAQCETAALGGSALRVAMQVLQQKQADIELHRQQVWRALSCCCASTVFPSKTVPFHAVLQVWRATVARSQSVSTEHLKAKATAGRARRSDPIFGQQCRWDPMQRQRDRETKR